MPNDEDQVRTSVRLWSEVVEEADPKVHLEDEIGYVAYEFAGGQVIKRAKTDYTA